MVRTSSILKPIEECVFEMAEVVVVVVNPIIRGGPGSLFEQGGEYKLAAADPTQLLLQR